MKDKGDRVAAIIVEPVAGNMGLVLPKEGFLQKIRSLCDQWGSLLIFDEVITGFRVAYGGAQSLFNISPDLSCFGKIIGGGLPVGAYGGRRDIMAHIAPLGPVYQAGTLSGNPLAMAAGIATLKELAQPGFYDQLNSASAYLFKGLQKAAQKAGIPVAAARIGSLMGFFFTSGPVDNMADAQKSDLDRFGTYYKGMRSQSVYLAPSQFESMFVSAAHDANDFDLTIQAAEKVFADLNKER
jgi:glutamate-1-semialdehyde 2,1-aminomutase